MTRDGRETEAKEARTMRPIASAWAPVRAKRVVLVAIIACTAIASFFGVLQVKRHHDLVRVSYELSEVTEALRVAEAENRRLRLERSLLTAPSRLEAMAIEIGMVAPPPANFRVVDESEESAP